MAIDVDKIIAESKAFDNDFVGSGVTSVTLGELYEDGWFDLTKSSWSFPQYSDEQHKRLCSKILNHFYTREIGVMPPGLWKREFLRKLDEIMPKYIYLYKKLDSGLDSLNAKDEFYKSRNIVSDFPQTMLSGNEDYASMGTDHEYERINDGTIFEYADNIASYNDVDLLIINELETMFSCLYTVSINAW